MAKKWEPGEIIAAIGAVVAVAGQAVSMASKGNLSLPDAIKVLGLAVFVAGIVLSLREISQRLGELSFTQRFANTLLTLSDTSRRLSRREPKSVYLAATTEALSYLVSDYVPKITTKLEEFATNPRVTIEVSDHSPIFDLMYRLGQTLPTGSVWLGITLLENPSAWVLPAETRFGRFKHIMRKRARSGELGVARIYFFQNESSLTAMQAELSEEIDSRLAVRILREPPAPPDISLLYSPKRRRSTQAINLEVQDPIAQLRDKSYERLCALTYDAHAGTLLKKLSILPGDSTEFSELEGMFADAWKRSTGFSPAGQKTPA